MFYSDDPIADFERHSAEQERNMRRLPVCSNCRERIQQGQAIKVDGKWFCEDCENEAWELVRSDYLEEVEEDI